jgi:hypothetical protein
MVLIFANQQGFLRRSSVGCLAGDKGVAKEDMDDAFAKFCRLTVTAAKKVLSFYEARRQSKAI